MMHAEIEASGPAGPLRGRLSSPAGSDAPVVPGTRDIQVAVEDAQRLPRANPRAGLALVADASHVLKIVRTQALDENLAAYSDPERLLADSVVEASSAFVRKSTIG
ncbi:hypothetical protein DIE14_12895 [Burkholderia sp. Bp9017]|uniref:hypothetical protein n=1 Tax=Burkholderia TaxID=32008 RepID=UPI000F5E7F16|nr:MULTISPECIES: hypothetical protein [Burkholderia]MBY4871089.1 hypothetical protein [Burkholderia anthina]RQZ26785.1 hypothetical protein DIE14_12895 [Burkholderia sp. Bp9017]